MENYKDFLELLKKDISSFKTAGVLEDYLDVLYYEGNQGQYTALIANLSDAIKSNMGNNSLGYDLDIPEKSMSALIEIIDAEIETQNIAKEFLGAQNAGQEQDGADYLNENEYYSLFKVADIFDSRKKLQESLGKKIATSEDVAFFQSALAPFQAVLGTPVNQRDIEDAKFLLSFKNLIDAAQNAEAIHEKNIESGTPNDEVELSLNSFSNALRNVAYRWVDDVSGQIPEVIIYSRALYESLPEQAVQGKEYLSK